MKRSLLVVGHGSRSEDAVSVFNKIVALIKQKSDFDSVEGAHMELAKPGIHDVIEKLVGDEVGEVIIAPYFLYEGIHYKEDIPEIVEKLSQKYPEINFILAKPIGFEPLLADVILKRAADAV
ncbi:MAG: hypothetical protein GY754_12310 [bacterium]|nr:hypothetical protein [bacterium]